MACIRLQFSARNSVSSAVIRDLTHGDWSHVDAITQDNQLLGARDASIGSIPSGVQIRPFGYLRFSATKIVSVETTDDIAAKFWAFLADQVGQPYDEFAYAAFVIDRDWRKAGSWCCSELVARALEVSGFLKYQLATAYNRVAPCDLLLVLSVFTDMENA